MKNFFHHVSSERDVTASWIEDIELHRRKLFLLSAGIHYSWALMKYLSVHIVYQVFQVFRQRPAIGAWRHLSVPRDSRKPCSLTCMTLYFSFCDLKLKPIDCITWIPTWISNVCAIKRVINCFFFFLFFQISISTKASVTTSVTSVNCFPLHQVTHQFLISAIRNLWL